MFPVTAIFFPTSNDPNGSVELHGQEQKCGFDDVVLMVRADFVVKSGALYDGDLIRDDRYGPPYRVAFRQDFGWDCFEVGESPDEAGFILAEDGPHIEVGGNIYETPELLA